MKKNDIRKSFVKESGSIFLVVKKNNFKYYLSIVFFVLSALFSLICLIGMFSMDNLDWSTKSSWEDYVAYFVVLLIVFVLPIINYNDIKGQKEQFLILHYDGTAGEFSFWLKKANRTQVKFLLISDLDILSVSSRGEDEIILLSNGKLPWGNRKIVLSNEFKDRKEEVVEFLKLIFLNK